MATRKKAEHLPRPPRLIWEAICLISGSSTRVNSTPSPPGRLATGHVGTDSRAHIKRTQRFSAPDHYRCPSPEGTTTSENSPHDCLGRSVCGSCIYDCRCRDHSTGGRTTRHRRFAPLSLSIGMTAKTR
jgi:hypothetical protein